MLPSNSGADELSERLKAIEWEYQYCEQRVIVLGVEYRQLKELQRQQEKEKEREKEAKDGN